MGMQTPKSFAQPAPLGATSTPNSMVQESKQAPQLPGNSFMPLVQDAIPYVQSPNAVPGASAGDPNDPNNPQYGQYPYPVSGNSGVISRTRTPMSIL